MNFQLYFFVLVTILPGMADAFSEELNIIEWDIPTSDSSPHDIVVVNDGTVWFTEIVTNKIGKFDSKPV
jgi:streptogramin lyase